MSISLATGKTPKSHLSDEAMQKKALEEMRLPAIGCFVAGTLVHTKEGLKPIEQIKVGDWVLSRPENPEQGTETGYKRVTKTFRFEDKEVVRFSWVRHSGDGEFDGVYVTPNHPVWSYPHGWVAMGRMYMVGRGIPGTIPLSNEEWFGRDLVLADGSQAERYDVYHLYRTDRPGVAFLADEEDGWGLGSLLDFSTTPPLVGEEMPYNYEQWGDSGNGTRENYTTMVYNFEVEDWHTYFVGKTGLWVHNTNCLEATLAVAPGKGDEEPRVSHFPFEPLIYYDFNS
ncbi:polymorphic toxin-type HINT domain-containing protein [Ottowia sp.]|uniref:polymorphic toxin-type HINT domain-containing protein n=1 Tax=Ottowia sp. TaxID=1898956 RepID=UPI003A839A4C